jgi:hypothetical protein
MIVFALAGWSGFFVMAVELLSGRVLAPSFGNSIYVWGAVITVFMLALSVGYLAGGHFSVFSPSLRRLGTLLIAAGFSALPVGALRQCRARLDLRPRHRSPLRLLARLRAPVFRADGHFGGGVALRRRLLVSDLPGSGKSAGSLYFVSTFGSAAGTILTSFYLVLLFEVNTIVLGWCWSPSCLGLIAVVRREPAP